MKKLILFLAVVFINIALTSCHWVAPSADEEAVLIYHPMIWGHGGVDEDAVTTGLAWCWWSTASETFKIVPEKHQVNMEDLISNDNTPLDFHTVIVTQIKPGKTPILLQNYGVTWFDTNIYNHFCNRVRDYVSQHSPFDIIGKAIPNAEQLAEMNRTAKAVQAKQTQEREAEVQIAREKAERQRAIADKAYQQEMGLSAQQFIQLKAWDIIAQKQAANIDVLFNADGTNKMWNIK